MSTRNGRMLRASLITALVGVLGLVVIGRACPEEVAVSMGATVSAGIGEQPYSPLFRARAQAGPLEVTGSFDRSHKVESGAGWIAGVDVDTRVGWLIVGADYRHRNGGPWTKDVAFAHIGLGAGPAKLIYRHEVYTTAAVPNRGRFLELSSRYSFPRPRGFFIEGLVSGTRFMQSGVPRYGTYSQVALGRAWRSR